ncbi:beta strand repeat-containing protein [Plastoroseomonas hellenica]|uniref:beta strand repeat-containing protein n=1 Tax=Plastoroseomonas hellenica TaxID=2687306 RepID=UPI001BA926AD|nr:hypothetical protein [Plastoroseomonas hellenica]MBR0643935.1 hypothetical protein [Plastoroseomonas hellenica]
MRIKPDQIVNGFDSVFYLLAYPDAAASGVDPLTHFNTVGWKEGRLPNGLFDTAYYLSLFADIAAANGNPLQHYLAFGWREGRDPSPFFDTSAYLAANPDVAAAGVNPLLHFLDTGMFEGRAISGSPSPTTGSDYLIGTAGSDTINAGDGSDIIAALKGDDTVDGAAGTDTARFSGKFADYVITFNGAQVIVNGPEGSDRFSSIERFAFSDVTFDRTIPGTNPLIDDFYYYALNTDVWAVGADAGAHFATSGWKEGRDPNPIFDSSYYLQNNPDVAAAGVNPLEHYLAFGFKEARDPSAAFDTSAYLASNPDVAAAGINPLLHYLTFGKAEGRSPEGSVQTSVATLEDGDHVFSLNDFDFGNLASVTSVTIDASGVANGTLFLDADGDSSIEGGEALSGSGNVVSAADIAAGKLIFRPANGANGDASASFGYKGSDGASESAQGRMAVNVTPVNDAPGFALSTSVTGSNEDAGTQTVSNFLTSISTGPANESGQAISFVVNASNPSLFAIAPTIDASGTLRYTAAANASGTTTVTVFAQDNGGGANGGHDASPSQVFTIEILAVNDAPVLDASKAPSLAAVTEDAAAPSGAVGTLVSSLVDLASSSGGLDNVTDPDGASFGIALTATDAADGTWYYSLNGGASWSAVEAVSDASALLLEANSGTRLYFHPNANFNGTVSNAITFHAWDGTSGAAASKVATAVNGGSSAFSTETDTASITVTAVGDAPVVVAGGSLAYTENQAATAINATLTVTDIDSATLTGATVSIGTGFVSGEDVLGFVNQLGITGTYDASSGVLTLTGTASIADYQAALQSVTYRNSSDAPAEAARAISFQVNDGSASSTASTTTINVTAVNDAPTVTTTVGSTAYIEEQAAVVVDGSIVIGDSDSASLSGAHVTISGNWNTDDVLSFTPVGNVTGSYDPLSGVLTLTGVDTVANYQLALRSVTFANTVTGDIDTAPRDIDFDVTDTDLAISSLGSRQVDVVQVNDAPTLAATADDPPYTGVAVDLFDSPTIATVESGQTLIKLVITVSAVTGTDESLSIDGSTVNLTDGFGLTTAGHGLTALVAVDVNGLATVTLVHAPGILPADLQGIIDGIAYSKAVLAGNESARTITIAELQDSGGTGNGGDDTSSPNLVSTVNFNQPPTISVDGSIAYTENDPATVVDSSITITEPNIGDNIEGAVARITTGFVTGEDELAFDTSLATGFGITGSFVGDTLTLSGSATAAQYEQVLETVTYFNSSQYPTDGTRTISFLVNDGSVDSLPDTATATVASVNDAPVNLVPAEVQTVLAGGTLAFSQLNGNRISLSDLDALSGNETVTLSVTSGVLTLGVTTNVSVTGNGTNALEVTGSAADVASVLDSLSYNAGSSGIHTLTISANDNGNSGTGGSQQDTDTIRIVVMNPTGGGGPQLDLDFNDNHPGVEATGYGTTFLEGTSPIPVVDTDVTVTGSPESAIVTLVNSKLGDVLRVDGQSNSGILEYNSGDDVIGFSIDTSVPGRITITFISILGFPSPSDYEDALTKISFSNARTDLDTTDRVLTFVLNDGASDSNTAISTVEITAVSNLHAANAEENSGATAPGDLGVAELGAVFDAAVARWHAVGLSQNQLAELDHLDFAIANLAGSTLGEYNQGRIKIDVNGAGHGWFVDATPLDDIEFAHVLSAGGLRTTAGEDIASHFDLLTVVMHEIGHALGFGHTEGGHGLMSSELGVGERWLPDVAAAPHGPALVSHEDTLLVG